MEENIEVKDVQKTEYLDKNGLDMLWAKVKENTNNQVEVERNRAVAKENSIIDTKADKSALTNEVTRATGAESGLQAAIETKADALALSNYVLTTALNQQIDTLNAAISAKQDKPDDGNMFLQVKHDSVSGYFKRKGELKFTNDDNDSFYTSISPSGIYCWNENSSINFLRIKSDGITLDGGEGTSGYAFTTNGKTAHIPTKTSQLTNDSNFITAADIDFTPYATIEALTAETTARTEALIALQQKVTANTTAIDTKQPKGNYLTEHQSLEEYVKKTELPTVPTKTSELTNDSNFITADIHDEDGYYLLESLNIGLKNNGVTTINSYGIQSDVGNGFNLDGDGITFYARGISDVPTAQGGFINIDDYALNSQVTALEQTVTDNTTAIEGKQDKGNYIPYTAIGGMYEITSPISVAIKDIESVKINTNKIIISRSSNPQSIIIERNKLEFGDYDPQMPNYSARTIYTINGITSNKYNDCLATSDGTFKPISDFVLKSAYDEKIAALEARIAALEAKHPEATA